MSRNPDVAAPMCAERLRLSEVVTKAVRENYAAKAARDQAVKDKKAHTLFAAVVAAARRAESAAVAALNKHRKAHDC